jgi:signal transduction histidine kinase
MRSTPTGSATPPLPHADPTARPGVLLSPVADLPINILIVDDEPKNLVVLETVLGLPGYRLVRAESADQALLALVAEEFALLILDVRMPGMSGLELAQTIKGRKKTARVPIIFLTAYYNEDQQVLEGYGSGAVDYLHKPVNAPVLRAKVAVFAELHRKSREIEISNRALLAEVAERQRAERRLQELNDNLDRLVTERTQTLRQLESELREAGRRKDEFIATLAHELRNPLAPVRNAVYILQHEDAGTYAQRARDIIARQVKVMARLVDDLMDVSRINRGHIELRLERIDLATVIQQAVEAGRPFIEEGGHALVLDIPKEPLPIEVDPTRLSQVLVNLLANAAKYTDPGGRIELGVQRDDAAIGITVKDNGVGIAAEHLRSVFDMFAQVEDVLSRSRGGLGIGLSLVKHVIELHGGQVEAQSPGIGAGSTFVITLPAQQGMPLARADGESACDPQATSDGNRSLKILVVDDNHDGAESLAGLLLLLGHDVRTVHDGEAAVVEATRYRPDVILLDIGLPGVDGYEVCRRIRRQPWGAQTRVIALTGWGDREAQCRSQEAGFDVHLVKPVDESSLQHALAGLERGAASS